ncbi:hypothetical protein B296_00021753 [Ensete ventricosum]|uniref:Uncharacterized protein n=1 Tax=Ensete ventricosum TaxID=4639 RepID=A0A427AQZ6_ENSVE|nr:hypothetical protein B296_00021753 [Ensete ventricosum]
MRVVVCLSIGEGELLREHKGVKADGRKGQGSDNKSKGAQLPKTKRRLEWRCKATNSSDMDLAVLWGVIDPLLSWRESVGRERGRGGGEYKDKL